MKTYGGLKKYFCLFDSLILRWESLQIFTDPVKGGREKNEVDIFYCCSSYNCPHFPPPLSPTPLTPTSHAQSYPHNGFFNGSFILVPWWPFPFFPLSSSPTPLVTVSLFFISMSLVIFGLFVCFVDKVPLIGEIIWYLSFTSCLISLSRIKLILRE